MLEKKSELKVSRVMNGDGAWKPPSFALFV